MQIEQCPISDSSRAEKRVHGLVSTAPLPLPSKTDQAAPLSLYYTPPSSFTRILGCYCSHLGSRHVKMEYYTSSCSTWHNICTPALNAIIGRRLR